jgi:hypothetical protein
LGKIFIHTFLQNLKFVASSSYANIQALNTKEFLLSTATFVAIKQTNSTLIVQNSFPNNAGTGATFGVGKLGSYIDRLTVSNAIGEGIRKNNETGRGSLVTINRTAGSFFGQRSVLAGASARTSAPPSTSDTINPPNISTSYVYISKVLPPAAQQVKGITYMTTQQAYNLMVLLRTP